MDEEIVLAPRKRRDAVLRVIRSAKKRLLVSMFRCTDFPVLDAIGDALGRGVNVRLLLTPRAKGWEKRLSELGAYLESMGAVVQRYSDPVVKYHAKYLLADGGPALVTSMNLTAKCFSRTCDFILITRAAPVVAALEAIFETDWLAPQSTLPDGISERIVIGPDRARLQFTSLLEGARKSIRIIDHKLTDPSLRALLKRKEAEGVRVEVLGQGQLGGLEAHGKLILIDGRKAAFGSMALSALSLDFRREISIMVEDRGCVRDLARFYRSLALEAEPADAAGPASRTVRNRL